MKIFYKERNHNERNIYLFGVKVFSYKLKKRHSTLDVSLEEIDKIQQNYKQIENQLKNQLRQGKKLKVSFLVGLASMFPAKPLMKKMLLDPMFDVSIIVIPDLRFGIEKAIETQNQTVMELSEYQDIITVAPISEQDDHINILDYAHIVIPPLPYDVSHSKYNLVEIIRLGILPAIVNYGFFRSLYDRLNLISKPVYSLYWKVFVETNYNLDEFKNYSLIKGENAILSGYCKMDSFVGKVKKSTTKTIMIAPHHSLPGGFNNVLALSNFKKYAKLFLKLPDLYPNINFIFRPHPALFSFLSEEKQWGMKKVDEYISLMKSKSNVYYSEKGDYFDDFLNSDALIDDCGSYLVEYFYTKKPQCYLLKRQKDITDKFVDLGQKCLSNCYIAYNEEEIINFIENVVIKEDDPMKEGRIKFAEQEVMYNYPNVSENIVQYFKRIFIEV